MKTWKKIVLGLLAAVLVAGTAGWFSLDKETRGLLKTLPTNRDLLFWSVAQRDAAFRAMDRIWLLAQWHTAEPAARPRPLSAGAPLALDADVDAFMAAQRSAALLIVQGGKLRFERYGLGFDADGRWTSFSVAKGVTSTLVGAALKDGHIKSMDDKVTDYVAGLQGSAYEDVTIHQLLTMTSGVAWNEDYSDPESDVARFNNHKPESGVPALVSYMRQLPRAAAPGTRWHYNTGETNLIGILLIHATGRPLATYLQEKIWQPVGMEQEATWILSTTGEEISGCCLQAAPRDMARFGQFILDGAKVDGQSIVPDGWLHEATHNQVDTGDPTEGYGYQWTTHPDGSFIVRGAFGQGLFIDPARELVIVTNANWAGGAVDPDANAAREAFYQQVQRAVDVERDGSGDGQPVTVGLSSAGRG